MKRTFLKIALAFIALCALNQCAPANFGKQHQPAVDAATSESIRKSIPSHEGEIRTGSTGMYIYRSSRYLVEISPKTNAALVRHVFVDDVNRDGNLDSVWVNEYGTWSFGTVLGPQYRLIANSTSPDVLKDFIELGTNIRKKAGASNSSRTYAVQKKTTVSPPAKSQPKESAPKTVPEVKAKEESIPVRPANSGKNPWNFEFVDPRSNWNWKG